MVYPAFSWFWAAKSPTSKTSGNRARTAQLEATNNLNSSDRESKAVEAEATAREAQEELSERANEMKNRIDELKWILALIVTASGLFTLAQGVAAGFNAQSFTKQADDALLNANKRAIETSSRLEKLSSDIEDRFENMTRDVKAQYPIFADIEERRSQSYANLNRILKASNSDEGFDWRRHFYERMPLRTRQEILSFERFVSYEIASQHEPKEVLAKQLRRLAQFYWSKFVYEQGRGFGYFADIERAEFLLDLARRKIGDRVHLLNDLGNVRLESSKARMAALRPLHMDSARQEIADSLKGAIEAFEESIRVNPHQLRAYYNLAFINADYYLNLPKAITLLENGVRHPNWESKPVPAFTCTAFFNIACYYGRIWANDPKAESAENCLSALRKSAALGLMDAVDVEREYNVQREFERQGSSSRLIAHSRQGDLNKLAREGDSAIRQELERLKLLLSEHYQREG